MDQILRVQTRCSFLKKKWNFIRHILQGYEQGIFTRYLQDEDD